MALTLIAHTGKASPNNGNVTCDAINTTGATLLIICGSTFSNVGAVSDSKSNTWTQATFGNGANSAFSSIYYVNSVTPTVGTNHTFTNGNGGGTYPSINVLAFSGSVTSPKDTPTAANGAGSGTTIAAGSVTPTENNCVVISSISSDASPSSINGGFTIGDNIARGGNNLAGASAYLIQTTAAAANPTWTLGGSSYLSCCSAVFKAGAAAATGRKWVIEF